MPMRVELLTWEQAEAVAAPIRFAIFLREKQPAGIARLLPDGQIQQVDGLLQQAMRRPLGG